MEGSSKCFPPCSHGGPIEVASSALRTKSIASFPPCAHGGPIRVRRVFAALVKIATNFSPCSHGGPIELGSRGRRPYPSRPFRRVHTAAPLKYLKGRRQQGGRTRFPPCSHGGPIEVIGLILY